MMQIAFVRSVGKPDRIYVRRSDGSEVSWSFPTYGDALPHDLVHLVVEAGFGVRRGLWGCVDAGVDVARVNEYANRVGGPDKYAGFGEDRREVLLSEALTAAAGSPIEMSDVERLETVRGACANLGVDPPASLSTARMEEVRGALSHLTARWRTLVPKGALNLTFDPADPMESFSTMVVSSGGAAARR
jgi:hypothetical protein